MPNTDNTDHLEASFSHQLLFSWTARHMDDPKYCHRWQNWNNKYHHLYQSYTHTNKTKQFTQFHRHKNCSKSSSFSVTTYKTVPITKITQYKALLICNKLLKNWPNYQGFQSGGSGALMPSRAMYISSLSTFESIPITRAYSLISVGNNKNNNVKILTKLQFQFLKECNRLIKHF